MSGSQEPAPVGTAGRTSVLATSRPWVDWIAAGAFGFATYQLIVRHSHSPSRTLATLDWCVATVAATLLVAQRLGGRRLHMTRDISLLLVALAISLTVSTIASGDVLFSLPRLAMYPVFALFAMGIYLLYRDAPRIPLEGYCLAIAAVHVPFVAEALVWLSYNSQSFYPQGPRVPNFSHVRQFGEAGFLAATSGSVLMALARRWLVLPFLLTCVALFGIMAFGSRGALLSWMLCTVLLIGFVPRRRAVAVLASIAGLLTATAVWALHVTGLLLSPNLFFRMQQLTEGGGSGFDSGRLQFWFESLQVVAAHPLFGLGAEAYLVSGCCDRTISQPHNLALQLLMQTGVIGCALLVALVSRAVVGLGGLRRCSNLLLATTENRVLAAMLSAYLAYCVIDGLFYHPLPLLHFALFSGLFAAGLAKARAS